MAIPAKDVLVDLHLSMWREQMAQRERAEAAEARIAELERLLASARSREAAWAEKARGAVEGS